jgi:hypothetical protein
MSGHRVARSGTGGDQTGQESKIRTLETRVFKINATVQHSNANVSPAVAGKENLRFPMRVPKQRHCTTRALVGRVFVRAYISTENPQMVKRISSMPVGRAFMRVCISAENFWVVKRICNMNAVSAAACCDEKQLRLWRLYP